jgi:hypothetical protein
MSDDVMYVVAIDTRGLYSSDLNEGYDELTCSREYFSHHIQGHINTVCMPCFLADCCGLKKHLTLYFYEYLVEHTREGAWESLFPIEENNPGASLLTMDLATGYPRYNVQGVAYVVYDDGRYPLSREQVWGIQEMANQAKDIYFRLDNDHNNNDNKEEQQYSPYPHPAMEQVSKWCRQYRDRQWGPKFIYVPREQLPLLDESTASTASTTTTATPIKANKEGAKKPIGRMIHI